MVIGNRDPYQYTHVWKHVGITEFKNSEWLIEKKESLKNKINNRVKIIERLIDILIMIAIIGILIYISTYVFLLVDRYNSLETTIISGIILTIESVFTYKVLHTFILKYIEDKFKKYYR